MIYAMKIKMNYGYGNSKNCLDINSVYLIGDGFNSYRTKESIHDYLKLHPGTIRVNRGVQPYVVPAVSSKNEKYVRSEPNDTESDNLLALPRE
ncbi:MAG TPA: DUF3892 domain-containing protein [Clostridia bacterium]|nr:DUF3892 domain-containing protein [Clostridia bacterium]